MEDNYNYLFKYLDKENILYDSDEFKFQLKSHPDYPSLLSISDTLNFLNIRSGALKAESNQIDLLPERFIALLKDKKGVGQLYYVERINDTYYVQDNSDKSPMSHHDIEKKWLGVVLLVESGTYELITKPKNNHVTSALIAATLLLYIIILAISDKTSRIFFFAPLPVLGILLSVAALKDLFGSKSELINNFCKISVSTDCTTVVSSKKWAFLKFISFSDLSIVFFNSQFLSLLLFSLSNSLPIFFTIQKILLFAALPVIFLSIYYQKYIEKKWCPVCLLIIVTVVTELGVVLVSDSKFSLSIPGSITYALSLFTSVLLWILVKGLFSKNKELKDSVVVGNRFIRNYEIFKTSLMLKERFDFPMVPIVLGNHDRIAKITIVTNPFCKHCENAHKTLDDILQKYHADIKVNIIIRTNISKENSDAQKLFRNLYHIYFTKGELKFIEALTTWFKLRDIQKWLSEYSEVFDHATIDQVYNSHYEWCEKNAVNYTPAIFVNDYEFPSIYERNNLVYFVPELIEDESFVRNGIEV